ncbi:MAG: hypothetical protein IJ853_01985 [Rickettsiales bacterium]|nr:hypothetical protein [Rickettsiales bacterium]
MLFIFNSTITIGLLAIGIVISAMVATYAIKLKLYTLNNEFIFLQLGFYSMLIRRLIVVFTENIYLAFQFIKPDNTIDPVIDYLYVDDENMYDNSLANNMLNLNFGIISAIIKNQCLIIHSINSLFFSPNQLYFLSLDTQRINDDNII